MHPVFPSCSPLSSFSPLILFVLCVIVVCVTVKPTFLFPSPAFSTYLQARSIHVDGQSLFMYGCV